VAGSINKVIVVGNVGSQPEIRATQSTREELATFSVATSEKWKDKNTGEPREKTDWHKIVVFAPGLVKVIKNYVHKGSKIYIEGKMQTREYEGEDGIKRYITEVVLTQYNSTLVLLDSKKDNMDFGAPNNPYSSSSPINNTQQNNNDQGSKKDNYDIEEIKDKIPF
jgi:single-strand DNA-binding protein